MGSHRYLQNNEPQYLSRLYPTLDMDHDVDEPASGMCIITLSPTQTGHSWHFLYHRKRQDFLSSEQSLFQK